jgi:hypothetical protein
MADSELPPVASALTKELSQHNLQVLKEALVCADDLLGSWSLLPLWKDLVLTTASVPVREVSGLLISILQLLRHSNRSVASSARELLRKWFLLDASDSPQSLRQNHGSLLFRLVCALFQEALKLKPTGLDVLLQWLAEDLLPATARRWALLFLSGAGLVAFESEIRDESLSRLLQTLSPLLRHRDEKTREAALSAASHLFALDHLWFQLMAASPPPSLSLLSVPSATALLVDQMSPVVAGFLKGLTAEPSWRRAEGRVLHAVAGFLRKTTAMAAVGGGEEFNVQPAPAPFPLGGA